MPGPDEADASVSRPGSPPIIDLSDDDSLDFWVAKG